MKVKSLCDIYTSLGFSEGTIFVVPLINFTHSDSDYLYQLYKPLLELQEYQIQNVTIFDHFKFVVSAIISKKVLLHYHWLEFQDLKSMMGMPWKLLCILLFKLFGGTLVWTVHNLEPHDQKWLPAHLKMHRWMGKKSDAVHIHCSSSADLVSKKFAVNKVKLYTYPHPLFPAKEIQKSESIEFINRKFKSDIKYETPVLLFFGNISEYKRIENILDIIEDEKFNVQVLIAGPIKKGQKTLLNRLKVRSKEQDYITLIPDFISDQETPYLFGASDLCFFNYKKILTSGAVAMALSYKKSIIAPDIGCLSELNSYSNVQLFSSELEKKAYLTSAISTLNNE
tara:strand:+ start:3746 stop:4762 length:1017 start_codon:yes stop_codon:yes gene_type:complete